MSNKQFTLDLYYFLVQVFPCFLLELFLRPSMFSGISVFLEVFFFFYGY